MDTKELIQSYPNNDKYMQGYIAYQEKYKAIPRESDKVICEFIKTAKPGSSILDIGCSTGNLLYLLQNTCTDIDLYGGDLNQSQIDYCLSCEHLKDICFEKMDITALPSARTYDIVIVNAVLYSMDDAMFRSSVESIYKQLKVGGRIIVFDLFHPWKQELTIKEEIGVFPDGHILHFRSYDKVLRLMSDLFGDILFNEFNIPITLPMPNYDTDRMETHTVTTQDHKQLQFRGCMSLPWNHLTATKLV